METIGKAVSINLLYK